MATFPTYYGNDFDAFQRRQAIALAATKIQAKGHLLRSIPEGWTVTNPEGNEFVIDGSAHISGLAWRDLCSYANDL